MTVITAAPLVTTQTSVIEGVEMTETHSNGDLVAFSLQSLPTVGDVMKQRDNPCFCDICEEREWNREAVAS